MSATAAVIAETARTRLDISRISFVGPDQP